MKNSNIKDENTRQRISFGLTFYSDLIISLFLGLIISVVLLIIPDSIKAFGTKLIPLSLIITSLLFYYLRGIYKFKTSLFQCIINSSLTYLFAVLLIQILNDMEVSSIGYLFGGVFTFGLYSLNKQILDVIVERVTDLKSSRQRFELF